MAEYLAAYFQDDNHAALADLTPLTDPQLNISGDTIRVPAQWPMIGGLYAAAASGTLARLVAPSLRAFVNHDFPVIDPNAEPTVPIPFLDYYRNPIPLVVGEGLRFQMAHSAGLAEEMYGGVFFTDGPAQVVSGRILTARYTGTTTVTAEAWTECPLTAGQNLPSGRYQIVGCKFIAATGILGRLVVPGVLGKPGAVAVDTIGDVTPERFGWGMRGVLGEIEEDTSITAEFLCAAADTAQDVYLDLIPV